MVTSHIINIGIVNHFCKLFFQKSFKNYEVCYLLKQSVQDLVHFSFPVTCYGPIPWKKIDKYEPQSLNSYAVPIYIYRIYTYILYTVILYILYIYISYIYIYIYIYI